MSLLCTPVYSLLKSSGWAKQTIIPKEFPVYTLALPSHYFLILGGIVLDSYRSKKLLLTSSFILIRSIKPGKTMAHLYLLSDQENPILIGSVCVCGPSVSPLLASLVISSWLGLIFLIVEWIWYQCCVSYLKSVVKYWCGGTIKNM